jgi:hypothetical protein
MTLTDALILLAAGTAAGIASTGLDGLPVMSHGRAPVRSGTSVIVSFEAI